VNAALEREAEFDRLELEVGASTAPYLRATTAERDRRVLAAEVRRLREENAVYEPAAKNWPAMIARCEAAEAERDTWHKRFAQLESHRASCCWRMEQERDAAIAAHIAAQVEAGKWRTDFDAARAEVARLREAIQAALDSPNHMGSEDIDILLDALDTPAREGGEGR